MADRAYVISGAVIVSDDLVGQVRYHPQCPSCGYVNIGSTGSAYVGPGNNALLSGCSCVKCGQYIQIQIARGC